MERAISGRRATEFRRDWPTVLAGAAGCGLGIAGLLTYSSGIFVKSLEAEIGLSRGVFGLVFFGVTVAMAAALPFLGKWIDRRGPGEPALFGGICLALGFVALSALTRSVPGYALIMVAIGLLGIGSGPVSYSRAVSGAFVAGRGLALGITQMGFGLSAAIVLPLVTWFMGIHGWRAAYLLLAGLALLGTIPALFLLRRGRSGAASRPLATSPGEFASLAKSSLFLRQMLAFVIMALGFAGLLPHMIPLLRDGGLSAQAAAGYASVAGVTVIFSRLLIGWLADMVHAPFLAAAACVLCGAGCLILGLFGIKFALVGTITVGFALGTEADLISFMTARNFGLRLYGQAYAWQYGAFMLAAGVGPAWVGYSRDVYGSYAPALFIAVGLLAIAALFFLMLPRSPDVDQVAAARRSAPAAEADTISGRPSAR